MIERCRLVCTSAARPPSRNALDQLGRVRQRRQAARGAALDPHVDGRQVLAHQPAQVLAQPRRADELQRVGQLVEDDPVEERVAVDLRARRPRGPGSGATNSRRGFDVGLEQRQLVLAQHALRHVADDQARLRGERRPGRHPQRLRPAARRTQPLLEPVGHRREQAGDAVQVDARPLLPVDRLGLGQRLGRLDARVAHHVRLRAAHARV